METTLGNSLYLDKWGFNDDDEVSVNNNNKNERKKDCNMYSKKISNVSNDILKMPNIEKSSSLSTVNSDDSLNTLGEINIVEIDNENENALNLPCINIHPNKKLKPKKKSSDSNKTINPENDDLDIKVINNYKNISELKKKNSSEESLLFKKTNVLSKSITNESNNYVTGTKIIFIIITVFQFEKINNNTNDNFYYFFKYY